MVALSSIYLNEGHSDAIAKGGMIKDSQIGVCRKSELNIQIKKPTINAIRITNLSDSKILRVSPNKGSTIDIVNIIGSPIYASL